MKEFMDQIVAFWNNYWGEGLVAWLLLAAVIWLLLFRRKKETVKYLLLYLFLSFYGRNHSGLYRRKRILACSLAGAVYAGDRLCHDRISAGKKKVMETTFSGGVYCPDRIMRKGNLSGRELSSCS